jgi:exopolysaccharide biosynthesis polyprenyl glycosylphosphotransferase
MFRRHAIGFRTLLMLVDGALAAALLAAVSAARFGAEWLSHWTPVLDQPVAFALLYAVGWVVVLDLHGLYRPRARWTIRSEAIAVARATLVMALVTLSVLFVFRLPDVSRSFLLAIFPAQWAVTTATRVALRIAFERMRARGYNVRYVLVAGAGPRGQAFAVQLEDHRELGLRVIGFLDDDVSYELPRGWRILGPLDSIERMLHEEVIDEVAICLPFSQWDKMNAMAHLCEEEGKIVRVPVDILDRAFAAGRVEELDGVPVYSMISGPDRVAALVVKRVVDIAVAGSFLVVLSPLLIAIALAILVRDGPPVLFRQVRVGLHGRRFEVFKFRTMVRDAEARYADVASRSDTAGPAFKMTADPRITRLGRFLRRTSLDELPQLWNVLRGDMSLVGPRPAPPREVEAYDLWHRRRLSMKPGITGLWQVTARRSEDFDDRAQLDLSYIDRWSLWLDLTILARTIPAAFEGR